MLTTATSSGEKFQGKKYLIFKISIRTAPTTLLQIFCKMIHEFQIIFTRIKVSDNNSTGCSSALMGSIQRLSQDFHNRVSKYGFEELECPKSLIEKVKIITLIMYINK